MDTLMNPLHQKIKFKIIITNKGKNIQLVAEKANKNNNEIEVYEVIGNKKVPLSLETFESKYNLIYDIPIDPTQRLTQLTLEIKDSQNRYGNDVSFLREFISRTITEIGLGLDPKAITKKQKQIEEAEEKQLTYGLAIKKTEAELDLLENSVYQHFYSDYSRQFDEIDEEIKKIGRKIKGKTKIQKDATEDIPIYSKSLTQELEKMEEIFSRVTELLEKTLKNSKTQTHFNIWKRINLHNVPYDLEFDENLPYEIGKFKELLKEKLDKLDEKKQYQEVKMFDELIKVLENYKKLDVTIPGISKSISAFIDDLNESIRGNAELLQFYTNATQAISLLDSLSEAQQAIESKCLSNLRDLKKNKDASSINENDIMSIKKMDSLNKKLQQLKETRDYYEEEYIKKGKPTGSKVCELGKGELKKFEVYTEYQLQEYIENTKKMLTEKRAEQSRNDWNVERMKKESEDLKKRKPHEYQNYSKELGKILETVTFLEAKIKNTFVKYINDIINPKENSNFQLDNEDQIKYNNAVFRYLGKRVGYVLHDNQEYKVESIDVIKGIISTTTGKEIWLTDMGTGQSQSAYLVGLLNTSDKRIIIALFDEIAMMDRKSLEPIYQKFNKLYKEGQMLAGIVVQKAEEVNIISKIGKFKNR
jgi:exonuclease SbcC